MSLLQQAQAEGLCLHFPESLGQQREVSLEMAVNTLLRAVPMSTNMAFHWRYIDKPAEGQMAMLFLPPQTPFPNDGVRYLEPETSYVMNAGPGRELEVSETKSGFIPGSLDQNAWRLRRRYRLLKGGHPNFVLVHYTRGSPSPIPPSLMNQPIRMYPLRTVAEPHTIVLGDKSGQKVYPSGMQPPPPPPSASANAPGNPIIPGGPPGMANMAFNHPSSQAAIINQQNNAMENLERRREREREKERAARERSGSTSGRPPHDDGSDDETEQISTRSLALARYKRNHDLMNEVFRQAAFGDRSKPVQPGPHSIFNKEELETKNAKLEAEIELLKQKAAERQAYREKTQVLPDVSMESLPSVSA